MDDSKEEKKKHKVEEETQPEAARTLDDKEETEEDDKKQENQDDKDVGEDNEEDNEAEEEKNGDGNEEDENTDEETESQPTHADIRKSEVLRRDLNRFVRDNQPSYNLNPKSNRLSGKLVTLILFILTIVVIGSAIYFVAGVGSPKKQEQPAISPPTSTPTPTPSPTPKTLNRSEWSFEVLNGSGVTGAAKKLADSLKALGYQVVKVGNADKDYQKNEFFVQEDLMADIAPVVVDIKDIIKIASISGQLKDSTASARIIIGKE